MFRVFKEIYNRVVFDEVPPPKNNVEFYNCTFHKLGNASLTNCSFNGCKFAMTNPEDIIGLNIAMDCFTFSNLELSPEVFDMLLLLICKTKGNADKRRAIIESVVGHDRSIELLRTLERVERH
jgi:Zn-finger protein